MQVHGEEHDQKESDPELRDRVSDDAEEPHGIVDPPAAVERGDDAEWHTDADLQHEREDRELERRR